MDMSLLNVGQQFTIYGGYSFLAAGLFGNSMTIYIFASVHNYRTTPCTFYFLIGSIINNLYVLFNLTSHINTFAYGIDLTSSSVLWCKVRNCSIITFGAITFTCSCLATIYQFFATSRNVHLRNCSNIKWAHRIMIIVIIFWCLHGIPALVLFDIISESCTITNSTYNIYISVFVSIFLCVIPMLIMIVFGLLTYRNIRQTIILAEQHADRQLVKMILIQIILVVISNVPFAAVTVYNLITANIKKDFNRQMKELLAVFILIILNYSYYIVSALLYNPTLFFCILFRAIFTCF